MMRLKERGLVRRSEPVRFEFDGQAYEGYSGDTLASALLANGVHLVGRSFKYHRPRGIFSAGPEEPNALMEIGVGARKTPNSRATTVELFDGLKAFSQNRFPSLKYDFLAIIGLLAPFLSAGFYYKTFMWPASFWEKVYEPAIRRAAGLGFASGLPDPDEYEKSHAFCDVLVIGSGPAGLMAALTAARAGTRVILAEQDFELGGRLLSENVTIDQQPSIEWVWKVKAELSKFPEVKVLLRTTVVGCYDGGTYSAVERVTEHLKEPPIYQPRQRLWKIVAKRAIVATGTHERLVAFSGNDRPGVMLASAMRSYVNRFGVIPGNKVCIFTANDDGWQTALDIRTAGINVVSIIDPRVTVNPELRMAAESAGIRALVSSEVIEASGSKRIQRNHHQVKRWRI